MDIREAKNKLRTELVHALGPDLPGISGFGAGLDSTNNQLSLNVHVDNPQTARVVVRMLPKTISGLRVRVSRRGLARFD